MVRNIKLWDRVSFLFIWQLSTSAAGLLNLTKTSKVPFWTAANLAFKLLALFFQCIHVFFFLGRVPTYSSNCSIFGCFFVEVQLNKFHGKCFPPWRPLCFHCSLWEPQCSWHVYVNFGLSHFCWLSPIPLLELQVCRDYAGNQFH